MKDHYPEYDANLLDVKNQPHQTLHNSKDEEEEYDTYYPTVVVDSSNSLQAQDEQASGSEKLGEEQQKEQPKEPKLYIRRWFQLVIYALCMVTTIISLTTYTTSGTLLMKYYRLDANWKINMTNLVFLIVHIPITFMVSFVLKRFGLRWSLIIFSVLTCIGAWIRLIGIQGSEVSFWLSLIGQTFIAIGQPFITQCTDLFGVLWFGNKERTVVQVVVLFSGVFGSLLSNLIGPRLMTMGSESEEDLKISQLGLGIFLSIQGVMASLCVIFVLLFFKSKPLTPPAIVPEEEQSSSGFSNDLKESLTEGQEEATSSNDLESRNQVSSDKKEEPKDVYPPQTFIFGLKKLMASPSFLMLLAASTFINSFFQSIYILEQIIKANKYTAIDSGNLNIIMIIFATISSIGLSILFDKTKQFKLITVITSASASLGLFWFCILMLWQKNDVLLVLSGMSFVVIGTFSVPTMPLLSQMIVYATYPVHPSTTMTITSTLATVWSILFMVFINVLQLCTELAPTIILWTNFALLAGSFLLIVCFRGKFSAVLVNNK